MKMSISFTLVNFLHHNYINLQSSAQKQMKCKKNEIKGKSIVSILHTVQPIHLQTLKQGMQLVHSVRRN